MKARLHVRPIAVLLAAAVVAVAAFSTSAVGCRRPGDRDSADHLGHGQVG